MAFNLPNQGKKEDLSKREKELEEKRNAFINPAIDEFINQSSFKESANVQAKISTIQKQPATTTDVFKDNTLKTPKSSKQTEAKTTKQRKKKNPEELKVYKIDTYLPEKAYQKFLEKCEKEQRTQAAMLRMIILNYIEK